MTFHAQSPSVALARLAKEREVVLGIVSTLGLGRPFELQQDGFIVHDLDRPLEPRWAEHLSQDIDGSSTLRFVHVAQGKSLSRIHGDEVPVGAFLVLKFQNRDLLLFGRERFDIALCGLKCTGRLGARPLRYWRKQHSLF